MHFNLLLRIKSRGKCWSEAIYIMVSGHLHNGLYQLDVPSSLSQPTGCLHSASHLSLCSSCNKQLLTLWHNRLRHPYPVVLNQVLYKLQLRIDSSACIIFVKHARMTKFIRLLFPWLLKRLHMRFNWSTSMFGAHLLLLLFMAIAILCLLLMITRFVFLS